MLRRTIVLALLVGCGPAVVANDDDDTSASTGAPTSTDASTSDVTGADTTGGEAEATSFPATAEATSFPGTNEATSLDDTTAGPDASTSGPACNVGAPGCPCTDRGTCDPGLECQPDLEVCVLPDGCPTGEAGCECGADGSCNEGLVCFEGVCVSDTAGTTSTTT